VIRVELLPTFKFTGKTVKILNLPIIIGKIGKTRKTFKTIELRINSFAELTIWQIRKNVLV
jgi:hypothetical protein